MNNLCYLHPFSNPFDLGMMQVFADQLREKHPQFTQINLSDLKGFVTKFSEQKHRLQGKETLDDTKFIHTLGAKLLETGEHIEIWGFADFQREHLATIQLRRLIDFIGRPKDLPKIANQTRIAATRAEQYKKMKLKYEPFAFRAELELPKKLRDEEVKRLAAITNSLKGVSKTAQQVVRASKGIANSKI